MPISIATTASAEVTTNFSAIGGVRIKQSFATGAAADTIAKRSDAKAKLDKAAGFDRLAKSLAQARADAATLGGEVKTLVAALPDPKLNDAVDALLQSGLPGFLRMDEAEVKSIKDEPAAAEKRRQLSEVAQDLEGKEAVKLLTDYRDRLKAL